MSTDMSAGRLIWLAAAIALCVSAGTIALMLARGWAMALDRPNERSLHQTPTPRMGGVGVFAGLLLAGLVTQSILGTWLWIESLLAGILAAVSLVDDRRGLTVRARLLVHLAVAGIYAALLFQSPRLDLPALAVIAFSTLAIVTLLNFYNFMDGANGMAGSMACIGFGACALGAWPGDVTLAALCAAVAAAAAGFLPFNLKGRIFMGDSGAIPLGFLAGALGLKGWHSGLWPLWFPVLIFAPFIADAAVTLARRILRGEPFWLSHRQHYYQRIVLMGASHAQLAVGEAALMLLCAGAAVWALRSDVNGHTAIFATIGALLLILMLVIDARWKRFEAGSQRHFRRPPLP